MIPPLQFFRDRQSSNITGDHKGRPYTIHIYLFLDTPPVQSYITF